LTCCCPTITLATALPLHLVVALPSHLTALPSRLVVALPSRLAPFFFKYLLAPPYIVASLPCHFALSIVTPSSFSCASGGAWSNTNKLHPTKVFVF